MVPPGFARQFADYNPQYLQLLMLDNTGHCPHDECPDQVNRAILDWTKDAFCNRSVAEEVTEEPRLGQ